MAFFDESYYLQAKLKHLAASKELDANGQPFTEASLKAIFAGNGITAEDHYKLFGNGEKLNPHPYFNEAEYLVAKVAQLNSIGDRVSDGSAYTMASLAQVLQQNGISAADHYEQLGSKEPTADVHLINTFTAFDANAYVAVKLVKLQASDSAGWAGKTVDSVFKAFTETGVSPVTHCETLGAKEASEHNLPLVQTVPAEQRVANGSVRETLKEIVPTNYNPPTAAPQNAVAAPVTKTKRMLPARYAVGTCSRATE